MRTATPASSANSGWTTAVASLLDPETTGPMTMPRADHAFQDLFSELQAE
jgi:hypothetical protein